MPLRLLSDLRAVLTRSRLGHNYNVGYSFSKMATYLQSLTCVHDKVNKKSVSKMATYLQSLTCVHDKVNKSC